MVLFCVFLIISVPLSDGLVIVPGGSVRAKFKSLPISFLWNDLHPIDVLAKAAKTRIATHGSLYLLFSKWTS